MRRKHSDHAKASSIDPHIGHNPLLRRSDRAQARTKSIVVTLMILMLPLSAWFAMTTLSAQIDRVSEQQHSRHSVTATTTAEAKATALAQSDVSVQTTTAVDATWTYAGVEHQGQVSAVSGSPAGTETAIWVDDNGVRSMQPLTHGDAVAAAMFTGIGSLLTVTLLLYGMYAAYRFHLDNQRESEWDLAIKNFMDENSLS